MSIVALLALLVAAAAVTAMAVAVLLCAAGARADRRLHAALRDAVLDPGKNPLSYKERAVN